MDHSQVQRVLAQSETQRKQREGRRRNYQAMLYSLRAGFKRPSQHNGQQSQQIVYQQIRQLKSREHQIIVEHYQQNPYQTNLTQISQQNIQHDLHAQLQVQILIERQEQQLLIQNKALKQQLIRLQTFEKERLQVFSNTLKQIRHKYTAEVEKLTASANNNRQIMEDKLKQLKSQIPRAEAKCSQIETVNSKLREQVQQGNVLMGKYVTEIKQQYISKINKIEKIYEDSQEKIEVFKKKFNEDEFVQNTLKNEQILKGIEENAKKAEQATHILEDYNTLLSGKREILQQIHDNNLLKQKEIEKMAGIEKRMKDIMERLNRDNDVVVEQNRRMAGQLMEVKKLLMGGLQ